MNLKICNDDNIKISKDDSVIFYEDIEGCKKGTYVSGTVASRVTVTKTVTLEFNK